MIEKLAIRYDDVLTKLAKSIFGEDIVEKVYVATDYLADSDLDSLDEAKERLDIDMYGERELKNMERMNVDAQTIVIEFSNGNEVVMGNSEWCQFHKPNQEIIEI